MIIHLDSFFFQNVCLDFALMLTINKRFKKRQNVIRILTGCVSINICYLGIFMMEIFEIPYYYWGIPVIACFIIFAHTYKIRGINQQITLWKHSMLVLFTAGGAAVSLSRLIGQDKIRFRHILFAVILSCFLWRRMDIHKNNPVALAADPNGTYDICFKRGEKMGKGKAFYDTGNQLKSVINGRGIAVVTWRLAKELLDDQEKEEYKKRKAAKNISGENKTDRFYKIVYETIGEAPGEMPGILADEVEIITEEGKIVTKSIMIGISPANILKQKKCDCLLPADIFEERNRKAERR